jgi:hypothetical protein
MGHQTAKFFSLDDDVDNAYVVLEMRDYPIPEVTLEVSLVQNRVRLCNRCTARIVSSYVFAQRN